MTAIDKAAALLSIYHRTLGPARGAQALLPLPLRPMSVNRAFRVLRAAGEPQAFLIALAKLIGAGLVYNRDGLWEELLDVGGDRSDHELSPRFGLEQLPTLVRPFLTTELGRRLPRVPSEDLTDAFQRSLVGSPLYNSAAHDAVFDWYARRTGEHRCRRETLLTDVDLDLQTMVTTFRLQLRVERPFAELVKVLDPVSWSLIGPEYFPKTYMVKVVNGKIQYDQFGDPLPHTRPQPIGVGRQGLFFEQFGWSLNGSALSEYRNILDISFSAVPGTEISMSYSLTDCLRSSLGADVQAGGIDIDSGYAIAKHEKDDWWCLEAEKNIRFTDRTRGSVGLDLPYDAGQVLNYFAPSITAVFLDKAIYLAVCAHAKAKDDTVTAVEADLDLKPARDNIELKPEGGADA